MPKKPTPPLIYVDTDVWIDWIVGNMEPVPGGTQLRGTAASNVFEAIEAGDAKLAASSLTVAEVCCNGKIRLADKAVREDLDSWFLTSETVWIDIDRYLSRSAVTLLNLWRDKAATGKQMHAADALHLAAAIELDCDYLFTQDGGFPHGYTIGNKTRVMRPDIVWEPSLFMSSED